MPARANRRKCGPARLAVERTLAMVPSMVNPPLLTFALGGAMLLSIAGAFAQSPPAASPAQPPGAKPPSANGANAEHLGDAQGWPAFAETDKNAKPCYL